MFPLFFHFTYMSQPVSAVRRTITREVWDNLLDIEK